jgi:hypothetical protein
MRYLISIALILQLFLPAKVGSEAAAQGPVPGTQALSGNDLLRECTFALRFDDGDRALINEELTYGAHCGGYLLGFYEGYGAKAAADKVLGGTPNREVCFPDNLPTDQMVRVVVKYLREHPERLNQAPGLLVVGAFYGAFPCK